MANTTIAVGVKRKRGPSEDPSKKFVCDCGRKFASKRSFTSHLHSHSAQNAPPASFEGWKQHYEYTHIFGLPDGRVWSCAVGRFLEGSRHDCYVRLAINGKDILRHCLNFEIANGRAIGPNMEIDHIVAAPKPAEGCERLPQDDSWANLQELTRRAHRLDDNRSSHSAGLGQGADLPGEVWKAAIYYDKAVKGVRVSNMGRVEFRSGLRTHGTIADGRHVVKLRIDNKDANIRVYNIVAHTFLGSPPTPKHTVDHIDGDSLNDFLGNLRWATSGEQNRNRSSNKAISKYDLEGKLLDSYGTIAEAAENNNLSWRQVDYAARTGSTRSGFRWEFVEC